MDESGICLRDARDEDADALIDLIGGVWSEYPDIVVEVEREAPDIRRIASAHAERGGEFWVAERGARIVGCVGWLPADAGGGVELRKLYVAAPARRAGLGSRLCARVEEAARGRGFVELWSDTRFRDAHRLYERRGYRRGAQTRELHDLSDTVEYYYRLDLPA